MAFVKKKQTWTRFSVKAAVLFVLMAAAGVGFASRYRIGIDPQVEKCIPGVTFYLVDMKDKGLMRGKVYAFTAKGLQPFFRDGTRMVKFLRGMPADMVEVTAEHAVLVNGEQVGKGLFLTRELKQPASKFIGKGVLADHQYWFMGLSDRSFDSRYWGTVKDEQIIGRAYPLF